MTRSLQFLILSLLALSTLLVAPLATAFADDSQSITTVTPATPTPTAVVATPTPDIAVATETATPEATPSTLPVTGSSPWSLAVIAFLFIVSSFAYFLLPSRKE